VALTGDDPFCGVRLYLSAYDSEGVALSDVAPGDSDGDWAVQFTPDAPAKTLVASDEHQPWALPVGTAYVALVTEVGIVSGTAAEFRLDAAELYIGDETLTLPSGYFDGDTAPRTGGRVRWTGARRASVSEWDALGLTL
jgi:hypothetical protein